MTDTPTNEMALSGVPGTGRQPFTVILMMTDDIRSDECCAADWVRRTWVYGDPSDSGIIRMIEQARTQIATVLEWIDEDMPVPDDVQERMDTLEPVAVYAGHIFDIYQP